MIEGRLKTIASTPTPSHPRNADESGVARAAFTFRVFSLSAAFSNHKEYCGLKPSRADLFCAPLYNEEETGEKTLEEETGERLRVLTVNLPINVRGPQNAESVKRLVIFRTDRLTQIYPLRKEKALNFLVIPYIFFVGRHNCPAELFGRQKGCKLRFTGDPAPTHIVGERPILFKPLSLSLRCPISQRSRISSVSELRDGRLFPKCKLMTHAVTTTVICLRADLLRLASGVCAGAVNRSPSDGERVMNLAGGKHCLKASPHT
ncbi:Dihydropyrimidine dehydrogenase [NADP(+)] [Triplophysa tibetana]|uniref:Dihydropyrimidine dehydrogenase [NADP(+)] n=1 Tax=Triplophysa tibetana TaxID=1572043 RepID=A0A5A9N6A0_9TELE|nr:Dihydropyrimidine dehydrogenase [NADP(+)] [Triplophysa tibetana]